MSRSGLAPPRNALLRKPKITKAGLLRQRPDRAEVFAAEHGAEPATAHTRAGAVMKYWPLGAVPYSPIRPTLSNGPAARPMVASTARLVQAQSGSRAPTVLISRVAGVLRISTCQSSSPSTWTRIDHALSHATSISHRTASLMVAELKYLAQLSCAGAVE